MKIGLYVPVPHVVVNSDPIKQSVVMAGRPLAHKQVDVAYTHAEEMILEADRAGFNIALFAERHLGPDLEAWVLGGAIGSKVDNIKIMPAVHPSLWHPAMVAKLGSTLDRISRGRLAINLVTGWWEEEHRMFGGDLLLGEEERYVRAEEFVEVIKGLWTYERFDYDGKFFKLQHAGLPLKPATEQPPEFYTASRSPRGLEMVAKTGDWWFAAYDRCGNFDEVLESVKRSIADMRQRCEKYGTTVKYALNAFVVCDNTTELAVRRAERLAEEGIKENSRIANIQTAAINAGLVGSADLIAERINLLAEAGIELILMKFYPTMDELQRISQEIFPKINNFER